jgi:hypothetical protein
MNKHLDISIYVDTLKKTNENPLEIKFNNNKVTNYTIEYNNKRTMVKFSVQESTSITQSILEIKNAHKQHYINIADMIINDFSCLSYFPLLTNDKNEIIMKPDREISLRWSSPYSYYFLKNFDL